MEMHQRHKEKLSYWHIDFTNTIHKEETERVKGSEIIHLCLYYKMYAEGYEWTIVLKYHNKYQIYITVT